MAQPGGADLDQHLIRVRIVKDKALDTDWLMGRMQHRGSDLSWHFGFL